MRALGKRAGLMATAIKRFEDGEMLPPLSRRMIRGALEAEGIEFFHQGGGEAGVRPRDPGT
jgi:hypothetical protein